MRLKGAREDIKSNLILTIELNYLKGMVDVLSQTIEVNREAIKQMSEKLYPDMSDRLGFLDIYERKLQDAMTRRRC